MKRRIFGLMLGIIFSIFTVNSCMAQPRLFSGASNIDVGVYYYVWYDEGLGNKHWKEQHGSENVVDKPFLGYYASYDAELCRKHIHWFEQLGLDFAVISWWGISSWEDNATSVLFDATKYYGDNFQLAIMVEPFNETDNGYSFTEIYDHIYNNYVSKYPLVYYKYHSEPLLCFYNAPYLTANGIIGYDDRFTSIIVGHQDYVEWIYWSVPNKKMHGTINVMPRYDDSRVRFPNQTIDGSYKDGLYIEQWENALNYAEDGEIDIIMITSFNEFHERTQIEPCFDATSYKGDNEPFYLYNITKTYITMLKQETRCSEFVCFVREIFGDIESLSGNQCRYAAVDNQGYGLDTLKIIENPSGGYLGIYHSNVSENFQVRLANSTDILNWTFTRTIEQDASQPTIADAPNDAYIVAFEKHVFVGGREERHVGFHYYSNLTSLLTGSEYYELITNFTVVVQLEGTPNIYNVTIKNFVMNVCVGFHYNDAQGLDNAAVGHLTIPLEDLQNMTWNDADPQTEYNRKLREHWNVRGHFGDRDYGEIFGKIFILQEGQYVKGDDSTWGIFLYDHSKNTFHKLDIATHKGSTSFSNPTFTVLKSPNGRNCIVVTYFLHSYKDAAKPGEAGELIFYKEFKTEQFPVKYEDKLYFVDITSNSTIPHFDFSKSQECIKFNVTGPNDSKGFCVIRIPKNLVQDLWQGNYTILLNGEQWPFENWTYTENTYIYINYIHSEHEVTIIPEFPSTLILPLLMIFTFVAVALLKKKKHSTDKQYMA